jgi:hypothetical protein
LRALSNSGWLRSRLGCSGCSPPRCLLRSAEQSAARSLADCALEAFQRIKSKAPKDPRLYYDIANGYQALYELHLAEGGSPFECEEAVNQALKDFGKAGQDDPRVLTNRASLYDMLGRPVEAIDCYEAAMRVDPGFGVAIANKGTAVEYLASIAAYPATCGIYAHQLYQEAFQHEASIRQVGGNEALADFRMRDAAILRAFTEAGQAELLDQDLRHEYYDESSLSPFVRFYTDFCVRHRLYLNLHIYDQTAAASICDTVIPRFVTGTSERAREYVNDIAFRLNEISESFMTARLALVQPQLTSSDLSATVKQQGWRLFGLYLLCQDLCGSKYSQIRNALTHRYLRVYRMVDGPKGTYTFEELNRITIEAIYQIKCAIMYLLLFIEASERAKRPGTGLVGTMPLSTRQHLDSW